MTAVAMGSEPQPRGPRRGRGRPLGGPHDDFLPLGERPVAYLGEVPVADSELEVDGLGLPVGPHHPDPPRRAPALRRLPPGASCRASLRTAPRRTVPLNEIGRASG